MNRKVTLVWPVRPWKYGLQMAAAKAAATRRHKRMTAAAGDGGPPGPTNPQKGP